jgi:hypothetical protein
VSKSGTSKRYLSHIIDGVYDAAFRDVCVWVQFVSDYCKMWITLHRCEPELNPIEDFQWPSALLSFTQLHSLVLQWNKQWDGFQ